jgi:peptidyl-tRNA hydrolase, PTH2 family
MTAQVKQVIVIRKDLKLKRAEIAALASKASLEFLVNNSENKESNLLNVELTPAEIEWLSNNRTTIVLGIPSENMLRNLIFRSEIAGIPSYSLSEDGGDFEELLCASFGPDDSEKIDEITGKLKLI